MKVIVRHIDDVDGHSAGDMNPEQLNHFVHGFKRGPIVFRDIVHENVYVSVQYIYDSSGLYAEIVWGTDCDD